MVGTDCSHSRQCLWFHRLHHSILCSFPEALRSAPRRIHSESGEILTEVDSRGINSRSNQTEYNIVHLINFRDTLFRAGLDNATKSEILAINTMITVKQRSHVTTSYHHQGKGKYIRKGNQGIIKEKGCKKHSLSKSTLSDRHDALLLVEHETTWRTNQTAHVVTETCPVESRRRSSCRYKHTVPSLIYISHALNYLSSLESLVTSQHFL